MTLVPCGALSMCSRTWERYQGLQFVVRGDVCEGVNVGGEYEVIGVPTAGFSDSEQHLAVNTVIEVSLPNTDLLLSCIHV